MNRGPVLLLLARIGVTLLAVGAAVALLAGRTSLGLAILAVLLGGGVVVLFELWAGSRRAGRALDELRRRQQRLVEDLRTVAVGVSGAAERSAADSAALSSALSRAEERWQAGLRAHAESLDAALFATRKRIRKDAIGVGRDQTAEMEALLQLYSGFEPRALMPATGSWAVSARALRHLLDLVAEQKPRLVVELGSGTSSVWLGYAVQASGARLITFDHDAKFADLTRQQIERHGLTECVEVRHAPLVGSEKGVVWYDSSQMADLRDIDILLVDGPPGHLEPRIRSHAFPVLRERLAANAIVVLDDSQRPDEDAALHEWIEIEPSMRLRDQGVSRLGVLQREPR